MDAVHFERSHNPLELYCRCVRDLSGRIILASKAKPDSPGSKRRGCLLALLVTALSLAGAPLTWSQTSPQSSEIWFDIPSTVGASSSTSPSDASGNVVVMSGQRHRSFSKGS
jgi:hypothetical protein